MRTHPVCIALLAAAAAVSPARGQQPAWNPARHLIVVTSALDSADAYAVVVRAFETEGLIIERSDTSRGRIVSTLRPSDSYGGATATVRYLALVHRLQGGGSEIWLGGLIHTRPQASATNPNAFFQSRTESEFQQRPEGDRFFVGPSGASMEWQRLARIAETIAHAPT